MTGEMRAQERQACIVRPPLLPDCLRNDLPDVCLPCYDCNDDGTRWVNVGALVECEATPQETHHGDLVLSVEVDDLRDAPALYVVIEAT